MKSLFAGDLSYMNFTALSFSVTMLHGPCNIVT